jgi:uncharacterized MAPEG superfamily protein
MRCVMQYLAGLYHETCGAALLWLCTRLLYIAFIIGSDNIRYFCAS